MRNFLYFMLLLLMACLVDLCRSQECTKASGLDPFLFLPDGPYTSGQFIDIACSSGSLSGSPVTYCLSGTFNPPLEDVTCNLGCQSPIANQESLSIVGGGATSYLHHDVVSFDCATNYQEPLMGPTDSTCNNGTWEPDPNETRCQAPCPAQSGTDQEGQLFLDGETANLTCRLNTNEANLECSDGMWSDTTFNCPIPDCVRPDDIDPNVLLNSGSTEFFSGDFISVTCAEGSTLTGIPVTYCSSDGSFTNSLADVVCSFRCQSPRYAVPEGTYEPGDSARFSCQYGDSTSLLLTCNGENGEWDQVLECPEPPTTMNSGTDSSYTDNSTATAFTTVIETESLSSETTYTATSFSMTRVTGFATDTPLLTDEATDETTIGSTADTTGTTLRSTDETTETTLGSTDETTGTTLDLTVDTTETTLGSTDSPTSTVTDKYTAETTLPRTGSSMAPLSDFTSSTDTSETTTPTQMDTDITVMTTGDVQTDITSAVRTNTRITVTDSMTDMPTEDFTDASTIGSTVDVTLISTPTSSVTEAPTDLTTGPEVFTDMTTQPTTDGTTLLETESTTGTITQGPTEVRTTGQSTTSPIEEGSTVLGVTWVIEEVNGTSANYTDDLNDPMSQAYQDLAEAVESAIIDLLRQQLGETSLVGIRINGFYPGSIKVNFTLIFSTNFTGNASILQDLLIQAVTATDGFVNGSLSPTVLRLIEELITVIDVTPPAVTTVSTTEETFSSASDITEITEITETEQSSTNRMTDLITEPTADRTTERTLTDLTTGTGLERTSSDIMTESHTEPVTQTATNLVTDLTTGSVGDTTTNQETGMTTKLSSDSPTDAMTEAPTDMDTGGSTTSRVTGITTELLSDSATNTDSPTDTEITTDTGSMTDTLSDATTDMVSEGSTTSGVTGMTTDSSTFTGNTITTGMETGEGTTSEPMTDMSTEPSTDGGLTERTTASRTEDPRTTRRSTTSPIEEGTSVFDVTWVIEEINGTTANYTDDLNNPASETYQTLVAAIESAVEDLLNQIGENYLINIDINGFSSGSIKVSFTLTFNENFTLNATVLEALLIQAVTENGGFVNTTTILRLIADVIRVTAATSQRTTSIITEELTTIVTDNNYTELVTDTTQTPTDSSSDSGTVTMEGTERTTAEVTMGENATELTTPDALTTERASDVPSSPKLTSMFPPLRTEDTTEGTLSTGTSNTLEQSTAGMTTRSVGLVMNMTNITTDMASGPTTAGIISSAVTDGTPSTDVATDPRTDVPSSSGTMSTLTTAEAPTTATTGEMDMTTAKSATANQTPERTTSDEQTTGARTTKAATEPRATTKAATTARTEPCGSNTCGPQEFCLETETGSVCECLAGKERNDNGECIDGCNNLCDFDTEVCETNSCSCRPGRTRDMNGVCSNFVEFAASWTIVGINGTEASFTDDLNNPNSEAYQMLAGAIQNAVRALLVEQLSEELGEGTFINVQINGFEPGSTTAYFTITFTSALLIKQPSALSITIYRSIEENNHYANDSSTSTALLLLGNSGSVTLTAIENSECETAGICGENAECVEASKSEDPDGFICQCVEGYTDALDGRLSGSLDCREAITPTEQPSPGLATWEAVIIALSACTVAALLLFFCCLAYMMMVQRRRHYTQKFQEVLRSDPRRGDRQYSYGYDDDLIMRNENYRGNYPEDRGADGPMFFAKVIDGSESHGSDVDSVLDPDIERYGHSMMRMKQPPGPTLLPETALVPYSPDLSGNGPSIIYNDMAVH